MATLIDRTIAFDAESHNQGGIREYIYLCNFADVISGDCAYTEDGTSHEITAITMQNSKVWYKYTMQMASNIVPLTEQRAPGYQQSVKFIIDILTQLDVENLGRLDFNKVSVIVPLNDNTFRAQLWGRRVGMLKTAGTLNPADAVMGGSYDVTLSTPTEGPPENEAPHVIAAAVDLDALLT